MKLFAEYIKDRRREAAALALFFAVFLITFSLYRIPAGAVLYPTFICILLGAVFAAVDFTRVKARREKLYGMRGLSASTMPPLPRADSIEERELQEIISSLKSEVCRLEEETSARYTEMTEYYTLWAHQIKTPIAAMRLTLQNEDSPLSRGLASDLIRIEQYAEMVMTFLRLDSESSDYVFREYSLDSIIRQAVKKFAGEFIARRIRLCYEPTDKAVVTDEKWFGFVIEQVLSNALKYTKEGEIRIYMSKDGSLCIEDTGIGIAPEDLPRIFEKGYTGCNGRYDKRASGIGLYLCKRICRNLGAEISASSVPGQGTRICLKLEQYRPEGEQHLTKM